MPSKKGKSKAKKPAKDRTNRPKGHFRVDWSTEMEAFCFLLGVLYDLYRVDRDLLEEIVFRAFPIFMRAHKTAASFYDRIDFRWSPGRDRESWHKLDRLDERSRFYGTPFTQNQLNDLATLNGVIHAWAAQLNKTLTPIAGVMADFSHGVADAAGILHDFTDSSGIKRAALAPGEHLSADLQYKLESYWGDPIHGFTLANTLRPGEAPPEPNWTRAPRTKSRKNNMANMKANANRKNHSRGEEEDDSDGKADTEDMAPTPKLILRVAPPKSRKDLPKDVKERQIDTDNEGKDEIQTNTVSSGEAHRQGRPAAHTSKSRRTAPSSATEKSTTTSNGAERIYVEMKEEAIAASALPQQMCMAHYDSLVFHENEVRFKPGSVIPDSFCFPEEDVYEFGGYVYNITLDNNSPPELAVGPDRDRQTAVMAVCNTDVCDKCQGPVKEDSDDGKTVFDAKHSWNIVYRDHLFETADGTCVFVGNQGKKLPKYITKLPSTFVIEAVAMQFKMNGEPDPSTIFEVLVCDEKEDANADGEDYQQY